MDEFLCQMVFEEDNKLWAVTICLEDVDFLQFHEDRAEGITGFLVREETALVGVFCRVEAQE